MQSKNIGKMQRTPTHKETRSSTRMQKGLKTEGRRQLLDPSQRQPYRHKKKHWLQARRDTGPKPATQSPPNGMVGTHAVNHPHLPSVTPLQRVPFSINSRTTRERKTLWSGAKNNSFVDARSDHRRPPARNQHGFTKHTTFWVSCGTKAALCNTLS